MHSYKRGDDRGYFVFVAGGMTEDASLLLHRSWGTGFSYSPLAPLSQAWERGWG